MISTVPYSMQDELNGEKIENVLLPSLFESVEDHELLNREEIEVDENRYDLENELKTDINIDIEQVEKETIMDHSEDQSNDLSPLLQESIKIEDASISFVPRASNASKSLNGYERDIKKESESDTEIDAEKSGENDTFDHESKEYTTDTKVWPQEVGESSELLSEGKQYFKADENEEFEFSWGNNIKEGEAGVSLFVLGEEERSTSPTLYEYDNRNNLVKVRQGAKTTQSRYNGDGLRVEKTVNGKGYQYLYEYDKIILEVGENQEETARNICGINLLKREAEGESFSYLYNGHGDVTALLNRSG